MAEQDTTQDITPPPDPQVAAIMKGFRSQFPDYADMPDEDVLVKMHDKYYSDLQPKDYLAKLTSKFAPDYKPEPTGIIPFAKGVGKTLASMPGAIAKGIASGVAAPAEVLKSDIEGKRLEKIAAQVPEPDITEMRKKGYNEQQIRNVVQGYTATQKSLMSDVEQQAQAGIKKTAEGAAFYATLPFGGPRLPAGVTGKLAAPAVEKALPTLVGSVRTGALFGASYNAIDEGVQSGADAAAQGKSTSEILSAITKNVKHGVVGGDWSKGDLGGAIYGGLAGAAIHGMGAGVRSVGDGLTAMRGKLDPQWAARIQAAEASALKNRQAALRDFAVTKFQPNMLLSRFKPDYDAWQSMAAEGSPPEHLAANIAAKLYGQDAMAADPTAVQMIADKITPWLETQDQLMGPMVDLPKFPAGSAMGTPAAGALPNEAMAGGIPNVAVPPGAGLSAQGGLAPDMTPPALRGPVSQPTAPEFTPPAAGTIPPVAGLEGAPTPAQALPEALKPQSIEPEMQQPVGIAPLAGSPAASLKTPLDIGRLAPTAPEEIAPRTLEAPPRPAPQGPAESEKPAATIEPLNLPSTPSRLQIVREQGEPSSLSLPTQPVENVVRSVRESGPAVEGLTTTARKIEGATVDVAPSPDGTHVEIRMLKGAEHGQGASGKALDKLISTADAAGSPLQVRVNDFAGPRGGKIPASKIAAWYERRGFRPTGDETPGSITLVRSPKAADALTSEEQAALFEHHYGAIPSEEEQQFNAFLERTSGIPRAQINEAMGNVTEGQPFIGGEKPGLLSEIGTKLDAAAEAAHRRLSGKLGRLSAGVDPTSLSDLAIIGAAKMYRIGLTKFKPWAEEMVKDFGDAITEHLKPIFAEAQKFLTARMEKASATFSTANKLLSMAREGRLGADWYNKTKDWTEKNFGNDSDMFLRFLSATSAGMNTEANVTLALKAYSQWKLGLPFDGFIGNHVNMLERAVRGEQFGDRKIQSILQALRGDENAVVIDTRVMRTLGFKLAGKGQKVGDSIMGGQTALTGPQYQLFENVIRDLSKQSGMTPREFQAALWTTNKIHEAQAAQAAGSKRGLMFIGNFRPYEDITGEKLGGLTPLEWVEKNRLTYDQLANASKGVTDTRAGGGFTYDPYTFKPLDRDKGIVVTLASRKVPTKELTGSDVIDFAKRFKRLTDVYYGMNVGTFNLDKYEPGMSSIDFNVVLPNTMLEQAKELGRTRKQLALWDLGKGEEIPTGYTGPSASIPKGGWEKAIREVDDTMQRLDLPGRAMKDQPFARQPDLFAPKNTITSSTLEAMVRTPHRWAEYASSALGVSEDQVKKLVDEGKLTPMSDYDMAGKVEVHKDGTVWEYVDPTPPSYNIMKLVGSFRGGKVAQLLDYLSGKDILTGNDMVQNYKSQAGFIRPGSIPGASQVLKLVQKAQTNRIVRAMVKNQGELVTNPSIFKHTNPDGMSLWIGPEGQIVRVPFHLRNAYRVISQLKLKNPVEYDGPEHPDMQTILNHGFLRVQMHKGSFAADATTPLTDGQVKALKSLRPGPDGPRDFAGRVTAPNGEHRNFYRDLNEFTRASEKGSK